MLKFALRAHTGRIVSSNSEGNLSAAVTWTREWELLDMQLFNGERVAFRDHRGCYLTATPEGTVSFSATEVRAWEIFEIVPLGNGKFGFKSAHNMYLTAHPDGTVLSNAELLREWEHFELINYVALQTCHNKFVSAEPDGKIYAPVEWIKPWEVFTMYWINYSRVALKNAHGIFITSSPEGRIQAGATQIQAWEVHKLKYVTDNIWAVKSIHKKYWSAHPDGSITATAESIQEWEHFKIIQVEDDQAPPTSQTPEHISQRGLDLIKRFEGLRLTAYRCPSGVWTIGYGHTGGVWEGQTISEEEATRMLREDVQWAENAAKECSGSLNQNQLDALTSFIFNLGVYGSKDLLDIIHRDPNNFEAIGAEWRQYVRAGGTVLPGLVTRRNAEFDLYCE